MRAEEILNLGGTTDVTFALSDSLDERFFIIIGNSCEIPVNIIRKGVKYEE